MFHNQGWQYAMPVSAVKVQPPQNYNANMTNHDKLVAAMQSYSGKTLTANEIKKIVQNAYPQFSGGSVLPNVHGILPPLTMKHAMPVPSPPFPLSRGERGTVRRFASFTLMIMRRVTKVHVGALEQKNKY